MASSNFGIRQSLRTILKRGSQAGRREFSSSGAGYVGHYLSPDFYLPLNDLGDGEVNIAIAKGVGEGTFTRATPATTILANGLIKRVAAGIPRSYYFPDGSYGGYLAEGARTNPWTRSEEFDNASWTKGEVTVTANAATAPDGATTADKAVDTVNNTVHQLSNLSATLAASTQYTISVFAKAAELTTFAIAIDPIGQGGFNLSTGVVVSESIAGSASIEAHPNNWYRCKLTLTMDATPRTPVIRLKQNGAYIGDGSGLYLWGAQVEQAAFASSYIPTEGVAVTRNADDLWYPSSGNVLEAVGSSYAEFNSAGSVGNGRIIGSQGDSVGTPLSANSGANSLSTWDGTTSINSNAGVTVANGAIHKGASAWTTNRRIISYDGGIGSAGLYDGVMFGNRISIGAGSSPIYGGVKNVRLWKINLPDLSLQHLTGV